MSGDNLHDDADFERFLAGEDELSRHLKGVAQAEPSAELDAAVFARIEAAMAAEKVQTVETGPASNDPVGPSPVPGMRRRSLAYYWHLPVGVAAGILAVLAYRTAIEPYHPAPVALNDSMQSRVISPTPHVTAPADVTTEPGRVATAPAVIEPPDVAPQPAPAAPAASAAAPLPSIAAVAPAKEAAAPVATPRALEAPLQSVIVTGSSVRRADAETASPVQVITAENIKKSGSETAADVLQPIPPDQGSGVELAWTHDPARDARASQEAHAAARAEPVAEAKADYAALQPPRAEPAAPVEAIAMAPSPVSAPAAPSVAAAPPAPIAASSDEALRSSSSQTYGIIDQKSAAYGYSANAPKPELGAGFSLTSPSDSRVVVQATPAPAASVDKAVVQQATPRDARDLDLQKAHPGPRKWLASIEKKLKRKDSTALAEWDQFVAAYPTYPVKPKLRAEIDALRAKTQPGQPGAGK